MEFETGKDAIEMKKAEEGEAVLERKVRQLEQELERQLRKNVILMKAIKACIGKEVTEDELREWLPPDEVF